MKTGTRAGSVFGFQRRMKTNRLTLAVTVLLGLHAGGAHAVTLYWQKSGGNWGDSAKWNTVDAGGGSSGVPDAIDDTAYTVGGGWSGTVDVKLATSAGGDASYTIGTLEFRVRNGTDKYRRISNITSGMGVLTFDVNSGSALINGVGLNASGAEKQCYVGLVLNDDLIIMNNTTEATGAGGTMTFSKAIASGAAGTRNVTVQAVESGTSAPAVFQGVNTYTGTTTIQASSTANLQGRLQLASAGELRLRIQNGNAGDRIVGSSGAYPGELSLDGVLRLDISGLTDAGGEWNLVDVANLDETFGSNFGLKFMDNTAFTNDGGGIYSSGKWSFDTATGKLSLISSPGGTVILLR